MIRRDCVWPALVIAPIFALLVHMTTPISAGDLDSTALKFVSQDAAFFASALRLRQQYDALVESKAFQKIRDMPLVTVALAQVQAQWNNRTDEGLSAIRDLVDNEDNRPLLKLAKDAVSNEVFMYGGRDFGDVLRVFSEFNVEMQRVQAKVLERMQQGNFDEDEAAKEAMQKLLVKFKDRLTIPELVFGFRVEKPKHVAPALDRIEQLMREGLPPELNLDERLGRVKVGDDEFLSLKLDGTMIPWDELEGELDSEEQKNLKPLIEEVKKLTLVISLGLRDGYLLLSIGDDNSQLEQLGKGDLLADHDRLAPLRKHAGKSLTSISYASEEFVRSAGSLESLIDQYQQLGQMLLGIAELEQSVKDELSADLDALGEDLKKYVPKPSTSLQFSMLEDYGYEAYSYTWTQNVRLDGSQPLHVLNHVGGRPLLFVAGRGKTSPEDYQVCRKWMGRVFHYWEKLGVPQLEEEQREQYAGLRDRLIPLVKQLDQANQKQLIPALADGQRAVVLDARLESNQWHALLPPSEVKLPLPEIALVYGVSDAELLKDAMSQYHDVLQKVLTLIHEEVPDEFPEIKLPKPAEKEFESGTVYFYVLPKNWGLDKRLAINGGLSDHTAVLSLVPRMTRRLLKETSPKLEGPLEDVTRPMGAAVYVDFAGFLEVVELWINYGVDALMERQFEEDAEDHPIVTGIKHQVHSVMEILQCFRGVCAATYYENDAWVTHSIWKFEDLP